MFENCQKRNKDKRHLSFPSFLNAEKVHVLEIIHVDTMASLSYSQYHWCWWSGTARSLDISSHDIDLVCVAYSKHQKSWFIICDCFSHITKVILFFICHFFFRAGTLNSINYISVCVSFLDEHMGCIYFSQFKNNDSKILNPCVKYLIRFSTLFVLWSYGSIILIPVNLWSHYQLKFHSSGMFIFHAILIINSLWPNDAIWRQRFRSILAQVMACCLMAPSHYLNQYWLISRVLHNLPENNACGNAHENNRYNTFDNNKFWSKSHPPGANELTLSMLVTYMCQWSGSLYVTCCLVGTKPVAKQVQSLPMLRFIGNNINSWLFFLENIFW